MKMGLNILAKEINKNLLKEIIKIYLLHHLDQNIESNKDDLMIVLLYILMRD
jgi:hypothetical protein